MFKNISMIVVSILVLVELYISAAGNQHKLKKVHKGWELTKGTIEKIVKKYDSLSRRNVAELTIISESGSRVYAKVSSAFCIYEEGEEVLLEVKNGYHRFLGNERVGRRGRKELILGIVPMLVFLLLVAFLAYCF